MAAASGRSPASCRTSSPETLRKSITSAAVVWIIVAVAALTNPTADQHRDAIRKAVAERSALERILGVGVLTAFASSYHSLGVASYTIVNDRTVTVGAFGFVHVVS